MKTKIYCCILFFSCLSILTIDKNTAVHLSVDSLQALQDKLGKIDTLLEQMSKNQTGQVEVVAHGFEKLKQIVNNQHLDTIVKGMLDGKGMIQEITDRMKKFLKIVQEKKDYTALKKDYRKEIGRLLKNLKDRKFLSEAEYLLIDFSL